MSSENNVDYLSGRHLPHPRMSGVDFFSPIELERSERLMLIPRYNAVENMTHRTNGVMHELRVTVMSSMASKMFMNLGIELDEVEVLFKAGHHDDAEIITGDIPSPKKRNLSPEEHAKMEEEELEALSSLEWMIQKPQGFDNFTDSFKQYREQKSLVDRLVNYWDKFDGLHEAVHEVVCGDNPEQFKKIIREYESTFRELLLVNADWIPSLEKFFGKGFFSFPNADNLPVGRQPKDLNFTDKDGFIQSVSEGAPDSYHYWLSINQFIFTADFLDRTFPGWSENWPEDVARDLFEFHSGSEYKTTKPGLAIKRNTANPTFVETLQGSELLDDIDLKGAFIQMREGRDIPLDYSYFVGRR